MGAVFCKKGKGKDFLPECYVESDEVRYAKVLPAGDSVHVCFKDGSTEDFDFENETEAKKFVGRLFRSVWTCQAIDRGIDTRLPAQARDEKVEG